jgi:hypothetical protein
MIAVGALMTARAGGLLERQRRTLPPVSSDQLVRVGTTTEEKVVTNCPSNTKT